MYKGKTKPYAHQRAAFLHTHKLAYAALFMEQGTGKTKVTIDRTVYNFERGKIQNGLILCPKSLIDTWIEEIAFHCPERVNSIIAVWDASLNKATVKQLELVLYNENPERLTWLIANIEGIRTPKCNKMVHWFIRRFKVHCICDESSRIKTISAKQSIAAHGIADHSTAKTIMTGTPAVTAADYYSQLRFLMRAPLNYTNYYSFRAHYCTLENKVIRLAKPQFDKRTKKFIKTRKIIQITGAQNVNELRDKLSLFSFFVKKKDCLDLPDKIPHQRITALTPEGLRLYKDIARRIIVEIDEDRFITTDIALTKLLRLQQVVGGFLPSDDDPLALPIPGSNPKIDLLVETINEFPGPTIIWARFKAEHLAILRVLKAITSADKIGEITGRVKKNDREDYRRNFQNGTIQYLVCTQSCAGYGYTLTAAENEIYYSNTFSYEHREQSEDRAHRIGQTKHVNIIDLWCPVPSAKIDVDMKLKESHIVKKDMAHLLTDVKSFIR